MFCDIPEDLWNSLFMNLKWKDIITISRTCVRFRDYCQKHNIKEKVRRNGFPRVTGHCECHDVSSYTDIPNIDNVTMFFYESIGIKGYTLDPEAKDKLEVILDKVLNRLYVTKEDLVYGDLIFFGKLDNIYYKYAVSNRDELHSNLGIYIFDGCKIIPFDSEYSDRKVMLPIEFTVIKENVRIM